VGDAAHQIHPMAGQGVNLGFRDVMALQEILLHAHAMQDIGENTLLRKYERVRNVDVVGMNMLTTGLDYLFASENSMVMKATNWGLRQLNRQTTIKKLLIQQAAA
jgi:2-polyprenylphenol 6-hydroxylase